MGSPRITSISIHATTDKNRNSSEQSEQSTDNSERNFDAVQAKWEHMRSQVKGLKWNEVPPEMLRDFVGATMLMLEETEAHSATTTLQSLGVSVAQSGSDDWSVAVDWPEAGRDMTLKIKQVEHQKTERADSATFEVALDQAAFEDGSDAEIEQAARNALKSSGDAPKRETLVLIDALPDAALVNMVKAIEERASGAKDVAILMAAAGVMLLWQKAEDMNSQTSTVRFGGLTFQDKPVCLEGRDLEITMVTQRPGPAVAPLSDPLYVDISVPLSKPKM